MGGVGHAYIKRLFVDRKYKGRENPDDYVFIPLMNVSRRCMDGTTQESEVLNQS